MVTQIGDIPVRRKDHRDVVQEVLVVQLEVPFCHLVTLAEVHETETLRLQGDVRVLFFLLGIRGTRICRLNLRCTPGDVRPDVCVLMRCPAPPGT